MEQSFKKNIYTTLRKEKTEKRNDDRNGQGCLSFPFPFAVPVSFLLAPIRFHWLQVEREG